MMSQRSIAIIGARGIANYGGFETFVGEVAPRLCQKGYDVYCSHRRTEDGSAAGEYRGVKLAYFPFRFPKNNRAGRLFEPLYDWYFALKFSFFVRTDFLYCLGIAAGLVAPICRLSGTKVLINIDGLEWKRRKFRLAERMYIRFAYASSYVGANLLILDNSRLVNHIPRRVRNKAVFIAYGVEPIECSKLDSPKFREFVESIALAYRPHSYWLVVARLEPDNSIHTIVDGYRRSESKLPLVIVGDFSSQGYGNSVKATAKDVGRTRSVLFLGSIYDREILDMLRCYCAAYVHGHSVGGTNPSLLEAMSAGSLVIAHDNEFNREVAGDHALYFIDAEDLASKMNTLEKDLDLRMHDGEVLQARAVEKYGWESVVAEYDRLFQRLK
jgi:rhamnosyltransferase